MSTLNITTSIVGNEYVITATITSTGDIPVDIFQYSNTGTGLGDYYGVCTLDDYKRFQTYIGAPIDVFGNKFLKYAQGVVHVPLYMGPASTISKITLDVSTFKAAYTASQTTTQVIPL